MKSNNNNNNIDLHPKKIESNKFNLHKTLYKLINLRKKINYKLLLFAIAT